MSTAVPARVDAEKPASLIASCLSLLIILFQGVKLGIVLGVLDKAAEVCYSKADENDDGYEIDYSESPCPAQDIYVERKLPERGDIKVEGIEYYDYYSQFGRPHLGIGESELVLEVRIDIDGYGQRQICGQNHEGDVHVDHRRNTDSYEHQGFIDTVDIMVDEETVERPLLIPDSGESPVKRISEPVDDESE